MISAIQAPCEHQAILTADGKPFSHTSIYYFFDGARVRSTEGLRLVDGEHMGDLGASVVAISHLRDNKDLALADGQRTLIAQIRELREKVREFEGLKTPAGRTLKYVLMARE